MLKFLAVVEVPPPLPSPVCPSLSNKSCERQYRLQYKFRSISEERTEVGITKEIAKEINERLEKKSQSLHKNSSVACTIHSSQV